MQRLLPPAVDYKLGDDHRDDIVGSLAVQGVEECQDRLGELPVGRLDDVEVDVRAELRPPGTELVNVLVFQPDAERDQAVRVQRPRVAEGAEHAAVEVADRDDDGVADHRDGVAGAQGKCLLHAAVVPVDRLEGDHDPGDDDGLSPGAG